VDPSLSPFDPAPAPAPPPLAPLERDPFGAPRAEHPRRSLKGRLSAGLAALVALVAKLGSGLKAALLLLPKAKLLTTSATALLSVAAYSLWFGWWFAVGFVVLLFVHEMGHVIALRREGIRASAPMFIPFLGAVITSRSLGEDAAAEARVGLAGPVLGTVGAFGALALYGVTGSNIFRGLAYVGFLLNLFNLLPVVPLDGGRAMAAMTPWMWLAGLGVLAYLTFSFGNGIMPIILFFAVIETYRRFKARRSGDPAAAAYYRVRPQQRLAVAAVYVGLVVVLAVAMHATYLPRTLW
jgi:Zn-dependent protease